MQSKETRKLESDFAAIGKAAQILPSYIRVICQSRIDSRTEPEVLDVARHIALSKISDARDAGMNYDFFAVHEGIITDTDPSHILSLIEHEINSPTQSPLLAYVTNSCPLQAYNGAARTAKTKCWYCPVITTVIKALKAKYQPK